MQGKSVGGIYKQLKKELDALPTNEEITLQYCNPKRWCGVLLVDAKYVKVKGFDRKRAFIYGIDFLTHDIPVCLLASTENHFSYRQFFQKCQNVGYPMEDLVSNDHDSIFPACEAVFGDQNLHQLCHVHYFENIRRSLKTRTTPKYKILVQQLRSAVFYRQRMKKKKHIKRELLELISLWSHDEDVLSWLLKIVHDIDKLTNHLKLRKCLRTTNMIESYNKKRQGRLKTIQGFESFASAKIWLNAWILAHRFTPFTDCKRSFKKLNGRCSFPFTKHGLKPMPNLW